MGLVSIVMDTNQTMSGNMVTHPCVALCMGAVYLRDPLSLQLLRQAAHPSWDQGGRLLRGEPQPNLHANFVRCQRHYVINLPLVLVRTSPTPLTYITGCKSAISNSYLHVNEKIKHVLEISIP